MNGQSIYDSPDWAHSLEAYDLGLCTFDLIQYNTIQYSFI